MKQPHESSEPQGNQTPPFLDRLLIGDGENPPLAQNTGVVIGTLILFFPLGIYFLWRYTDWDKRLKWGLSVGIPLMMLFGAMQEPSQSNSSSSNGGTSIPAELNDVALLTTSDIATKNLWGTITPNRFHQMLEAKARETGKGNILPIRFTSSQHHDDNTGVTTLVQDFGKDFWCGYTIDHSSSTKSTIRLVKVTIGGSVFEP